MVREEKNPVVWHWNQSIMIFNTVNIFFKKVDINKTKMIVTTALYMIIMMPNLNTIF